jgi:hypothetical protein
MTDGRRSRPRWVDFQAPQHQRPNGAPDAGTVAGTRRRRFRVALWLTAIVLATAIVLPIVWRAVASPKLPPPALLGTWTTAAPKYSDRSFEISPTTLILHTGPGENDFTVHAIERVEAARRGDSTLYTLHSFYYASGPPASIRLPGQPDIIWRRATQDE